MPVWEPTAEDDEIEVKMEPEREIPIKFWLADRIDQGNGVNVLKIDATTSWQYARWVYDRNFTGIDFKNTGIVDLTDESNETVVGIKDTLLRNGIGSGKTLVEALNLAVNPTCTELLSLKADAANGKPFDSKALNVYYVKDPNVGIQKCPGADIILMKSGVPIHSLSHEIGHALSLDHLNASANPHNMMRVSGTEAFDLMRCRLGLGQIIEMNTNRKSVLNTLVIGGNNKHNSASPVRLTRRLPINPQCAQVITADLDQLLKGDPHTGATARALVEFLSDKDLDLEVVAYSLIFALQGFDSRMLAKLDTVINSMDLTPETCEPIADGFSVCGNSLPSLPTANAELMSKSSRRMAAIKLNLKNRIENAAIALVKLTSDLSANSLNKGRMSEDDGHQLRQVIYEALSNTAPEKAALVKASIDADRKTIHISRQPDGATKASGGAGFGRTELATTTH